MYDVKDERRAFLIRVKPELRRFYLRLTRGLRRRITGSGYFGEVIKIHSEVEIWNGNRHLKIGYNHFVNSGLLHLRNMMTTKGTTGTTSSAAAGVASGYWTMKIGDDTTTTTTPSMTALVSENATEPNTLVGLTSNPSLGVVRVSYTATWNAGTVSGTVGELGLRLGIHGSKSFAWSWTASSQKILASRLSAADGDFTSFVINEAAPLTIEWRVTFTFA